GTGALAQGSGAYRASSPNARRLRPRRSPRRCAASTRPRSPPVAGSPIPALLEDVRSVSEDLMRVWLSVMGTGQPPSIAALRPLVEGVRRRGAQGIDLHSLLPPTTLGCGSATGSWPAA